MTPHRQSLGRLPNLLSCSRLVLAAGFVASSAPGARVGLIGAAAITDFLDTATKRNQVTLFLESIDAATTPLP